MSTTAATALELCPDPSSGQQTQELLAGVSVPGKLTPVGLLLPEGLPYDDWLALTKFLFNNQRKIQWAIGDCLNYGADNYPDPKYRSDLSVPRNLPGNAAVYYPREGTEEDPRNPYRYTYKAISEATGYPVNQLYDIASVCRQVPISVRNEVLTFSHHRAVRALPTDRQVFWLNKAAELGFSVPRLRYEIGVHEKDGLKILGGGFITVDSDLLPPELQLPAATPETEKPTKKKKSAAKENSRNRLETRLSSIECTALFKFASERGIASEIAVRALVAIGLHASGHLQKASSNYTGHFAEGDLAAENVYLGYLGQNWFGDADKFQLRERISDAPENFHPQHQENFGHSLVSNLEFYIQRVADHLSRHPDLTVAQVQEKLHESEKYATYVFVEAQKRVLAAETPADVKEMEGIEVA